MQVTFTAEYSIDNSGWLANILVDKPLAPQIDAARALQAQITAAARAEMEIIEKVMIMAAPDASDEEPPEIDFDDETEEAGEQDL